MRAISVRRSTSLAVGVLLFALAVLAHGFAARAEGATWKIEQPPPPEGSTPIGLGRVGDVEFREANRGLLITAGNGSTIAPGLWFYNGRAWHELSNQCGASDGRIAWAQADEFFTISDGRPGQAANPQGFFPSLENDTICRFSGGSIVESFATLGFQENSYPQMHGAGCIGPSDCWFGGEPLAEPLPPGTFHLHWNGTTMAAEPDDVGHAIADTRAFDGHLYESVKRVPGERGPEPNPEVGNPSVIHRIEPPEGLAANAGSPFAPEYELPLGVAATELEPFHLGADAEALWAAAGPSSKESSAPATVLRKVSGETEWEQVIGSEHAPLGEAIPAGDAITAIGPEPGSEGAWIGLDTRADVEHPSATANALVLHVEADGTVSQEQELPAAGELLGGQPVGGKGAAASISCPAIHDCWMATTQGWLFHLSEAGEAPPAENLDPDFSHLITFRPLDPSLPQVASDAVPIDDSGAPGELPPTAAAITPGKPEEPAKVTLPLLADIHARLVHGTVLELSFHLAVKAQVRLLAERRRRVIASTPNRTFPAGKHRLMLHLNVHRWPTKLNLKTHALAPLPTTTTRAPNINSVSTSLVFPDTRASLGSGLLQ